MTQEAVLTVAQHALVVTVLLAGPLLLASLVVGLVVSVFQAVTQINEMTLSFVPKMAALLATLAVLGPWMLQIVMTFTAQLLTDLPRYVR